MKIYTFLPYKFTISDLFYPIHSVKTYLNFSGIRYYFCTFRFILGGWSKEVFVISVCIFMKSFFLIMFCIKFLLFEILVLSTYSASSYSKFLKMLENILWERSVVFDFDKIFNHVSISTIMIDLKWLLLFLDNFEQIFVCKLSTQPAMFKVNNRNTRASCEIC